MGRGKGEGAKSVCACIAGAHVFQILLLVTCTSGKQIKSV